MSKSEFLSVRVTEEMIRTLDRLRRQCESPPSRPEMVRQLIEKAGTEVKETRK